MEETAAAATSKEKKVLIPPDGEWGWIIVLGASLVNVIRTEAIKIVEATETNTIQYAVSDVQSIVDLSIWFALR